MAQGILEDIDHQNRLSVLCALTVFENGIQKYVNDQFDIFHQQLQNQMNYMKNQRCSIFCSKNKQHLHDWCTLCASWRTTILGKHRSRHYMANNNINWAYVDSSKWPEDAREVQKCFNPDWCFKGESSSEDVSVLLSSMNNCHHFKQDVKEIRKMRNIVSHKSKIKVKEKLNWCQLLINFLEDPDIWSYAEAKTATTDIMVLKEKNLIEIIETEKCSRLLTVVNEQTSKLQENWTYYQLFHHLLSLILFISLFKVHFAYDDQRVLEVTTADKDIRRCGTSVNETTLSYKSQFVKANQYRSNYGRKLTYLAFNYSDVSVFRKVCNLEFSVDFDLHLQQHQTFVGRHWLYAGIQERMDESKGVLLVADKGYGKSAAMANIMQGKNKIKEINVIHHFCIQSEAKFQRADTFILNIVQNLYCKYPSYGIALEKNGILLSLRNKEIKNSCKFDPVYCFDKLIIEPLSMFVPPEEEHLVLLIDALDECSAIGLSYSVLTVLQLRYKKLPPWIKLLITSRNDSKIIDNFSDLHHWHLYRESDNNKQDMLLYNKKNSRIRQDYIEYLKWNIVLLKDIAEKRSKKHPVPIGNFPTSIEKMFEMEFFIVFDNCRSNAFKRARLFFEIIIASTRPLTKIELFEIIAFSKELIDHDRHYKSDFQVINSTLDQAYFNKDIVKLKPFLHDWLTSLTKGHPCEVNKMRGHTAISRFMLGNIADNQENLRHDFVVELFMHINKSSEKDIDMGLLYPLRIYVDKTICGQNFFNLQYEPCHSVLDMFASVIDSFSLMRTMISFSESHNMTLAALNALLMGNTNSFIAILKGRSLDFNCFTNMMRLKTFVNHIYDSDGYFITDDDLTLWHLAIIKENHLAIRLIAKKEKETPKQRTKNSKW